MASPWTDITTAAQAAKKIASLQTEVEWHIQRFKGQPLPPKIAHWLNFKQMVQFWAQNADTVLKDAPYGVSVPDILFVLICYTYAIRCNLLDTSEELAKKADVYETVCKLQQLCMSLPDRKDLSTKQVFEDCVALVLHRVRDAAHEEVKKPRGFGMDYGDPQDEFTGDEQQMLDDLEEAKEREKEATHARLVNAFLPWCTRTFFEAWHTELLVAEGKTLPVLDDALAERLQLAHVKFDAWMKKQCAIPDLPSDFYKKLQTWTFRQLVGVGALRNLHRQPHMRERKGDGEWMRLFNEDKTQTQQPHELWLRKQEPLDILADSKHTLRETLELTMFATIFDCSYGKPGAFTDPHVVFRDELLAKANYIREDTIELLPRPPLLVQTGAGQWRIHHSGTWYPLMPMRDNLLLWCCLMRDECDSCLLSGVSITDWVKTFL